MKILMINKFLYPRGGAERYMLSLGAELAAMGHEVEYFGMADSRNTVGNSCDILTRSMDFHASGAARLIHFFYPAGILYSLHAAQKFRRLLNSFRPDIVHFNNIAFHLTPSVVRQAARLGVPAVQTLHDFQLVCPNHLLYDFKSGKPCKRCVTGSKWNCVRSRCIHGSYLRSALGTVEMLLHRAIGSYDGISLFISPSSFLRDCLASDPGFRGETVLLRNFSSLPDLEPDWKGGEYVLYFGRLSREKGIEALLEAMRRLPDIPFVIAGSGPLEESLREIPNVKPAGFCQGRELAELVARARFTVCPSLCHENCPLSVLESLALGVPVVAARRGGIPELVRDGETGLLVDSPAPEALAAAIGGLYRDSAALSGMRARCRERHEEIPTLRQYAGQITELYHSHIVTRK